MVQGLGELKRFEFEFVLGTRWRSSALIKGLFDAT